MSDMKQARADLMQMIDDDPDMPEGLKDSFQEVFAMSDAGLSPEEINLIDQKRHGDALMKKLSEIPDEKR